MAEGYAPHAHIQHAHTLPPDSDEEGMPRGSRSGDKRGREGLLGVARAASPGALRPTPLRMASPAPHHGGFLPPPPPAHQHAPPGAPAQHQRVVPLTLFPSYKGDPGELRMWLTQMHQVRLHAPTRTPARVAAADDQQAGG